MNQGFIPRFLVAMPDSRIHERQMIDTQWETLPAIKDYWKRLSELYDITPATRTDHPLILNPRKLSLTAEAARLYKAFGNQCFKKAGGAIGPGAGNGNEGRRQFIKTGRHPDPVE